MTTSYLGNEIVVFGERIVGKIPFVRSIYQAIKRIADSLFMDKAQSFKKVVIVEYPRRGVYSIGFITGTPNGEIQEKLGQKAPASGYTFPYALTPTTGVFVMVPRDELIEVEHVRGRGLYPDHFRRHRDAARIIHSAVNGTSCPDRRKACIRGEVIRRMS